MVLIVEDNLATARLLKTLLEIEGLATHIAAHEQEAWRLLQSQPPDVMLIDMHLAQAEGLDLLRAIRRNGILNSVAVVMTSALDRSTEALAAGADAFLLKPFRRAELIHNMELAIARRCS